MLSLFTKPAMKDKKLRIILNVNLVLLLLMIIMLFRFLTGLTAGNDIDPVVIIGSLVTIACLCYSLAFFIWNLMLYIPVFFAKIVKAGYYRNAIIILIAAVVIPYSLLLILLLIALLAG